MDHCALGDFRVLECRAAEISTRCAPPLYCGKPFGSVWRVVAAMPGEWISADPLVVQEGMQGRASIRHMASGVPVGADPPCRGGGMQSRGSIYHVGAVAPR